MKARQNESGGSSGNSMDGEVKTVLDVVDAVSIHVDEKTGRRYKCNEATGQTQWLSDGDAVNETAHEEAGESRMKTTYVTSFSNPRLDAETVHITPELSLESTTNNPNNSDLELKGSVRSQRKMNNRKERRKNLKIMREYSFYVDVSLKTLFVLFIYLRSDM